MFHNHFAHRPKPHLNVLNIRQLDKCKPQKIAKQAIYRQIH